MTTQEKVHKNGYIATRTMSRSTFKCCECRAIIPVGDYYFRIVRGGGGLGWIKFPDRTHENCLENYLERTVRR